MMSLTAEMALAMRAHEEIFRYWKSLKTRARLPGRADLDPARIHRRLPTISLIDVRPSVDEAGGLTFRQRLAGTELFTAYGKEITGLSLEDIYGAEAAVYWAQELGQIARSRKPNVDILPMSGTPGLYLFWLRLPLASNGVDVDMIFGHDVFIGHADAALNSGIRAA